jgi:hypothetical protein
MGETKKIQNRIVKAFTAETFVCLAILAVVFTAFISKMGLALFFKAAMATAHDLILNTCLFLTGVIILAGAVTALLSEFGIVSIINMILSPLMKPLFGLPGAASVGAVATYLSDNPAILPLSSDKGFLKYFKRWQLATLGNLGTVFGMGLIVTTFMLAQSSAELPLVKAVVLGNVAAIMGGILSVRLMGVFSKKHYGKDLPAIDSTDEGYDVMKFREIREGNVAQRGLQALLDGAAHGVEAGLALTPGVVVICTLVMMLAFGPSGDGGTYTGAAYEGIAFLPWLGEKLNFIIKPLFGFSNPEAVAFPVTSLGAVGAAISMVPRFLAEGIIGAKEICVFTAMGICNAGFLSTHVGIMDGLGERDLINEAIGTHFLGGLAAGVFGHILALLLL